jgi:hypothetical protein
MEKVGVIAKRVKDTPEQAARQTRPEPALPPHVEKFLALLQSHFAYSPDAREWDREDTRAYGRLVVLLTPAQVRAVFDALRERYTWRPSVAEVRATVETVVGDTTLPAYAANSFRTGVVRTLKAERMLLTAPETPLLTGEVSPPAPSARDRLREMMQEVSQVMSPAERAAADTLRRQRQEEARRKAGVKARRAARPLLAQVAAESEVAA